MQLEDVYCIYKMHIQNDDIQNAYHGMIYKMPIQKRP